MVATDGNGVARPESTVLKDVELGAVVMIAVLALGAIVIRENRA